MADLDAPTVPVAERRDDPGSSGDILPEETLPSVGAVIEGVEMVRTGERLHHDSLQSPVTLAVEARGERGSSSVGAALMNDAVEQVDAGERPQAPVVPVVQSAVERGSRENMSDEEEVSDEAPVALAVEVHAVERPQAPVVPVFQSAVERGSREIMSDEEEVFGQAPVALAVEVHAGERPQAPIVPVVQSEVERGSREIMSDEEEVSGQAQVALAVEVHARERPQAPVAPVVQLPGEPGSREIMSDEEEVTGQAPAALHTAVVPVDGRQQMEVERDGNLSRPEKNWVMLICMSSHPKFVKWVYAALFFGGILLAMFSRDTEVSAFSATERVHGCEHDRYCLSAESALRVSLAFFMFFLVMFITTVWTKKIHDWRNFWNSNLVLPLFIKIGLLAGCLYAVHFTPSPFIQLYGSIARFGAWLFLLIQLISVTKFIMKWNMKQQSITSRWRWLLQAVALLLNFGSFAAIVWLLQDSNIVGLPVVVITLMLMVIMLCFHLKSEVTEGWLAPGMMMAYMVIMCVTVITSEPYQDPKGVDWLTIVSLVVMAYSTLTTGEDEWLQFNEEVPSEDNIPYGFGYFHLVFALGSMYFGMILVGWNAHKTMERWKIDFGWWSAVVRAVNGLLAAVLYIWMLRTSFIWSKTKVVLSWSRASLVPSVTFL